MQSSQSNVTRFDQNTIHIGLHEFIDEFGDGLLDSLNKSNPPVFTGNNQPIHFERQNVLNGLKRKLYDAQANTVQAVASLLLDQNAPAAILNGEMGTGKTIMAIAASKLMQSVGYRRTLVLSPPHLVYKWRREILDTVPDARVWVLNGPDTLAKLLKLRADLELPFDGKPEYFILGRIRMRMGFHWRLAYQKRRPHLSRSYFIACPDCGEIIRNRDGEPITEEVFIALERRCKCAHCDSALWTLMRPKPLEADSKRRMVIKSMCQIPTIGEVTADNLIDKFGEDFLSSMLADNVHEFINLMDNKGKFVFSDRQAKRMERALANLEFGWGEGGYQPTEFVKRYLPQDFFDFLIIDEGHEYKNAGSAQGQAMGVLATKVRKILMLTGTLMGGYADDLFFLLFRILTQPMIEDGYKPSRLGSLYSAASNFMEHHGVLKEIYTEKESTSHKTAKGKRLSVRSVKAPGFGPLGILNYVLPYTVFIKLKDLGEGVLPPYEEEFIDIDMTDEQESCYQSLSMTLTTLMNKSLAAGDCTLLGVVMNVLLRWPDTAFKDEVVVHPRERNKTLAYVHPVFDENDITPKEQATIDLCLKEKAAGRRTLVYSVYTGKHDTVSRLKRLLERQSLKVAVLRSTVDTSRREDWIIDQVDRGIDVLITNPELVKTGLDLLEFPTICFLQTGFNVYTLMQAARRSWRIGQTKSVRVLYMGYSKTSQITCLRLMAKKIAVTQSTSGDIPESGLDALNHDGDSLDIEMAKEILERQKLVA
ncbi:hypothetical protein CUZ56_01374 [Saezia sanguinis]|uniref:Helicase ATP-binding domain-containing protein n=1 Tax=Saezia sanguinis TaxID=1965230 RepID=A0A433SF82_9BURK|nr:DEAD/DEAH box helicase [Saezia sanguinis]RUS67429.1 hypothetical protein CUZ56_01374 [Saezia sanguinis]